MQQFISIYLLCLFIINGSSQDQPEAHRGIPHICSHMHCRHTIYPHLINHTILQPAGQNPDQQADPICPYQTTCSHSLPYCRVTSLSLWPLCPTVLAFALGDTKQVVLCDVEKAEILHLFTVENAVSCMTWMEVVEESRQTPQASINRPQIYTQVVIYTNIWPMSSSVLSSFYNSEDESKLFLPKLPALPKR